MSESDTEEQQSQASHSSSSGDTTYGEGAHLRLEEGDVVGNYTVKDRIGVGQYGLVWTVDNDPGKVLKVMRADPDYKEEVENEVRLLRSFGCHDHVVRLLEDFEHAGHRVLAFERMQSDLFSIIHNEGWKDDDVDGLRLIRQVLRGVAALAEHKIVHLDLKPENILASRGSDGEVVLKVCDFGTAQKIPVQSIPDYGKTLEYRAPEIIMDLDARWCGAKADVWSAACIVYEILGWMSTGHARCLFEPRSVSLLEEELDDVDEENDLTHLYLIQEILGKIPKHLHRHCRQYFNVRGNLKGGVGKVFYCGFEDLLEADEIGVHWIDFLQPMVRYNPKKRASAVDMLDHPFLHNK